MNTGENRGGLERIMSPDWAQTMAPIEAQIHAMGDFLRAELAAGRGYFPAGENVFHAFQYPLARVKVLIVGQDPYPTPGHAMGLSFSVMPGTEIPRSLVNIFKEMHQDLGLPLPTSGDLRPWANQGVMLLNRALTVQPGKPASHRGRGWEAITEFAIRELVKHHAAQGLPLVAILWGADARKTKEFMPRVPCLESVHPSPLSASRGFFGSRPFSRANELLVTQGGQPVDWRLP